MSKKVSTWAKGGMAAIVLAIAGVMGAHFEGTRYSAYQDIGGVWTICQGRTNGVDAGDTATPEQCREWLREDMAKAYAIVKRCIHVPLTIGQQVAFTDAAYNLGSSVMCGSTLQRLANAGDMEGACNQLPRWVYANGEKLAGLVKRRNAERDVCLNGVK